MSRHLSIFLLLLSPVLVSAAHPEQLDTLPKFRVTAQKALSWTLCVAGGVAWGTHEAIYAKPDVLMKKFGFSKYSWGGTNAWERKYPGNRYEDGERPVLVKDWLNPLREAKKTTALVGRYYPIVAGISLTLNKKHRHWLDYLIALFLYSGSATVTYNLIRN